MNVSIALRMKGVRAAYIEFEARAYKGKALANLACKLHHLLVLVRVMASFMVLRPHCGRV